jgi:hypothetical protein
VVPEIPDRGSFHGATNMEHIGVIGNGKAEAAESRAISVIGDRESKIGKAWGEM